MWLLLILCFLPFIGFAQNSPQNSPQSSKLCSDSLFAAGVVKYNSSRYKEAIPFFEQCRGIDTLLYAADDSRRFYADMWLASCYYKLGNKQKAASLYDGYMAAPIDRRLTIYSDSLSKQAFQLLYEKGDAASALPVIEKVLELETKVLGDNNILVANSYSVYAYALYFSGQIQQALQAYRHSLSILSAICGDESRPYASVYSDLVQLWFGTGDYGNAAKGAAKLIAISRKENDPNSSYAYCANTVMGDLHQLNNRYSESIPYYEEAGRILKANNMHSSSEYGALLVKLGQSQLFVSDIAAATQTLEKARGILNLGHDSYSQYNMACCLDYISQVQYASGQTYNAITTCLEGLDLCRRNGLENDYVYANINASLYNLYEITGSTMMARSYADTAIKKFRELGVFNVNFADLLLKYSSRLKLDNKLVQAIEYGNEAVSILQSITGLQDSLLAIGYSAMADLHYVNGELDCATEYAYKALKDIKGKFSPTSQKYVEILNDMALVIFHSGNRDYALKLLDEALSFSEANLAGSVAHYKVLSQYAQISKASGDYTGAVGYQQKAVALAGKLYGEQSDEYSVAFTFLLSFSSAISDQMERNAILEERSDSQNKVIFEKAYTAMSAGDLPGAISLLDDQVKNMEADSLKNVQEYIAVLTLRATLFTEIGEYTRALVSLQKASDAISTLPGSVQDMFNVGYWNILGKTYLKMSLLPEAESAIKKSLHFSQQFYGQDHIETLLVKLSLAIVSMKKGDFATAIAEFTEVSGSIKENVFDLFTTMSVSERMSFWGQISPLYNLGIPQLVYGSGDSKYAGVAYDALLFSKGLLLSTEQNVLEILSANGDEKATEVYNKLLDVRKRFEKERSSALKDSVKMMERKLIALSADYGDYTRKLRTCWEDVKASLGKNDLAVEFANFYNAHGDEIYVAYVLSEEMLHPQAVELFKISDFQQISHNDYYTTSSLYNLVFKPLLPYCNRGGRIYFAPTGILHNLAVESLVAPDGRLISEDYSLYRLSSTREIANVHNSSVMASGNLEVSLLGDINYDAESDAISQVTNNERGYQQLLLEPLEGTKAEVDSIVACLGKHNVKYQLFTGNDASESAIKSLYSLSSADNSVLHIATHGFYLENSTPVSDHIMNLISLQNMNFEDNALNKSGLYLAGANTSLLNSAPVEKFNDGILTSLEVASLNLRSVDLVVLSACETALGEIAADGVFGLQRGFKKAGANSILMSLWKVDDQATCFLMTEFYKHWIGGKSKHKALELAKNAVRSQTEKGWNNPKYWAAFILLDSF